MVSTPYELWSSMRRAARPRTVVLTGFDDGRGRRSLADDVAPEPEDPASPAAA